MDNEFWNLETVVAVIRDKPSRFTVTAHENNGTHDPLMRNPLVYRFKDQDTGTQPDNLTFDVLVSKQMAGLNLGGRPVPESHHRAIRFGLVSKASEPDSIHFTLKTDTYENQKRTKTLSGQSLRHHILRFFLMVNSKWPDQGIGLPDLCDNFYASEKDIKDWLEQLHSGNLLVQKRGWSLRWQNRGDRKYQTFKLTAKPDLLDRVEREVSSIEEQGGEKKHRVFISYSHNDRIVAGEIKQQLEENGLEAFLAHEDIEPSQEWCKRIKSELKRCDSFVPLITNSFRGSKWTDQESGWAMALKKTICPIMCDDDPHGFLSEIQAVKFRDGNIAEVCGKIQDAVTNSSNGKV